MARILGNNLPTKKKIYIALTCIYGIGISTSKQLLIKAEIEPTKKVCDLEEIELSALRNIIEQSGLKFEGDLKRFIGLNIKRLIESNCRRGKRHLKGLPLRGQRTHTNGKTARRQNIFVRKLK
uniref:Ribosomal protein S13 n=1 Tax=Spumella sp. Baekdong012001B8 TaxID=2782410 RepID=A0A7S6TA39_9STRA|nr:ribosomal protein S13 [Spumella sp. Baekdong012001B8]